jgi:GNAT superfamily N-acetyltransferase
MITIRQLTRADTHLIVPLCDVLIDVVHGGASVGFLAPLSTERAAHYWETVFAALGDGLLLWVAEVDGVVAGTVQLAPCLKENGRHRGDIQKLQVLSRFRGQGLSSRLMAAAETAARKLGLTLLVLDTHKDSHAESIYRHLGWQRAGEIPMYAGTPDGKLITTVYYYKQLNS